MTDETMTITAGKVYSIKQAASYLKMSYGWLYAELRAGNVPHVRLGTQYRIKGETLLAMTEVDGVVK